MPSASLWQWQNDRMPRLQQADLRGAALLETPSPNACLIDKDVGEYAHLLPAVAVCRWASAVRRPGGFRG
jgi:hypothetical protein